MSMRTKLACWFFGHRWVSLRVNLDKVLARAPHRLHEMDGHDADCSRCGAGLRDAGAGDRVVSTAELTNYATYYPGLSEEERQRRWPWAPLRTSAHERAARRAK